MRTTLTLDDVLAAAKGMAASQNKTLGEVVSALARKALQPTGKTSRVRNGVPRLAPRADSQAVRAELVNRLRDELP